MDTMKRSDEWKLPDDTRKALDTALWELRHERERIQMAFDDAWPEGSGDDDVATDVESYLEDLGALEQALEDIPYEVFDAEGKSNV